GIVGGAFASIRRWGRLPALRIRCAAANGRRAVGRKIMAKLIAAALGCASIQALAACQTPSVDAVSAAPETASASTAAAAPAATNLQQVSATGVHPGEAVYKQACATCHDNAEATRSPSRENLKGMSFQFVNYS